MTSDRSLGMSGAVVQTLMEPYLDKNHALFVDNRYSSPKLFEFLLSRKTGACGTERMRRKNMTETAPLAERGNVVHKQAKNILAVVWKDKRGVTPL